MWMMMAAILSTSCAIKTRETTYVDPDAYGAVEGTGIEARDVRTVATKMAGDLMSSTAVQNFADGVPRIAVLPVKNRSRFLIDQEIFTTLITDLIIQNAAGRIAILNRDIVDQIVAEREMKRQGTVDAGQLRQLAGADFFLEGEVRSLSASGNGAQSDYVVIRFQMTDAETGIVSWSNSYEMKKEGSWGVMYQ
ncbi:MAG: PBP1b-binding outer membrane lipoprotein LpoB [Myxococcota bacterium]|jgi:PBP1b-binding outer membrane lipoprotein LpoB